VSSKFEPTFIYRDTRAMKTMDNLPALNPRTSIPAQLHL
jgi:hypothetical protein